MVTELTKNTETADLVRSVCFLARCTGSEWFINRHVYLLVTDRIALVPAAMSKTTVSERNTVGNSG